MNFKFYNQFPTKIYERFDTRGGSMISAFIAYGVSPIEWGSEDYSHYDVNDSTKMVPVRWSCVLCLNFIIFSIKIWWKTAAVQYPESEWRLPKS